MCLFHGNHSLKCSTKNFIRQLHAPSFVWDSIRISGKKDKGKGMKGEIEMKGEIGMEGEIGMKKEKKTE